MPYRDIRPEYPPGALPAFVAAGAPERRRGGLPRALRVADGARAGVALVSLTAVALRGLGATRRRTVAALALTAAFPLLLGSVVLTRFDLLPAALVAGRARRARARPPPPRPRAARRGDRGEALPGRARPAGRRVRLASPRAGARRSSGSACSRPSSRSPSSPSSPSPPAASRTASATSSPGRSRSRASARRSTWPHTTWSGSTSRCAPGTARRTCTRPGPAVAAVLLTLAPARRCSPGSGSGVRASREELVRWSAAALVAFVALGKVLSPQFLDLARAGRAARRGAARAQRVGSPLRARSSLTQLWFPSRYWDLARDLELAAVAARARPRPRARRAARRVCVRGRRPRTGSIAVARPAASHSTSAPSIRTPPSAVSKRTGIPVRIR